MTISCSGPVDGSREQPSLPASLHDLASYAAEFRPIIANARAGLLARLGHAFFGGSSALRFAAERRQARLLAAINLATFALLVGGMLIATVAAPAAVQTRLPLVLGFGAILASGAYALSRGAHLRLAAAVTIALHWWLPVSALANGADLASSRPFTACAWLAIPVLLASGLVRLRATLLVAVVSCAVPVAAVALGSGRLRDDAPAALCFLVGVAVVSLALSRHRGALEQDRTAELRARNIDLSRFMRSLEAEAAGGAADLQKSQDDLERAYQALRKNQHALLASEKMASIGRLTAGIAQEMSAPLAAVRAALSEAVALVEDYARAIDDPDVTDSDHRALAQEMAGTLDLAGRAAERAAAFVGGIKTRTREASAEDRVLFDAAGTVREALQILGHEVIAAHCHVHFESAEQEAPLVGSPGKLSQVVTHLVSNALDANSERGGGEVHIALSRRGRELVLTVADEGPGIRPEHMKRIFDPMFTTKPLGKGAGLGLTLVHDIVCRDFLGHIDVRSRPGQGAEITVRLPGQC